MEFPYDVYDESTTDDEGDNAEQIGMINNINNNSNESQYEKANKYRFDVLSYFNNKRIDVILNELF